MTAHTHHRHPLTHTPRYTHTNTNTHTQYGTGIQQLYVSEDFFCSFYNSLSLMLCYNYTVHHNLLPHLPFYTIQWTTYECLFLPEQCMHAPCSLTDLLILISFKRPRKCPSE